MNFKKKLKQRLFISILYIVLGILVIIAANVARPSNEFLSSFGFALAICGIAQIRKNPITSRDESKIKKQELKETDERNIEIMYRAKSMTFSISIMLAGGAVIVLQLMNKPELALPIAYVMCSVVVIYWVCYFFVRRKH